MAATSRGATLLALWAFVFTAGGRAQDAPVGGGFALRLEAGMLNPGDIVNVTMALGGAVVREIGPSGALALRYLRQSQGGNSGRDLSRARQLLSLQWEHAFGESELLHRQLLVRGGGGVMFRPGLATAPLMNGAVLVRYPVGSRVALLGSVEDDLARLPWESFVTGCSVDGVDNTCYGVTYAGKWQHNIGLALAVEWRPGSRGYGRRRAATAPAPAGQLAEPTAVAFPAEARPVCDHLAAAPGTLVRLRVSSPAVPTPHGSTVGPLLRCGAGVVVIGPYMGQEAPELTIFESTVDHAWVRDDQGRVGMWLGLGSGAALGYVLGAAKSYLCDGTPCAKHQLTSTLIGAAIGGVLGSVFGRATPRWVRRYP